MIKKINDVTDPDEVLRQRLSNLTEKELRESLSRNLTKFCQQFGLNKSNNDDCQKIATIVLEQHKSWVQGWQGKKNKTAVNAWKFIEKYKS